MKFTKTILKNGLTVLSVPTKDSLSVTVLVMVHTGSKYETKDKNGISHFLEHMCFKGTKKFPKPSDISIELDKIGSQSNAFTDHEFTGYYAKAHPDHMDTIIDIVSDIYLNSLFDPKEIEKEKGVIVEEINMYEDMPHRIVQEVFTEVMYGDQPAGWGVAGTKETVRGMTREDFLAYHTNHYVAGATTIIVAGNFESTHALTKIENAFSAISTSPKGEKNKVIESQVKPEIKIKQKNTDQTHIVLGVRGYDAKNEKNYALKILSTVLGGGMSSRLFQKLREEMGVGYYVRAGVDEYTDHGVLSVSTGVDVKRVDEVVSAILVEMNRFTTELISDEELKRTKDYMIGNMYLGLESSDALAEYYAIQDILMSDLITPDELAQKVQKVTAEEIQSVAREIMRDDRLNMAIVGNIPDPESLTKIFHF
ncbi:MAG: pitrilysin family protein [Patescibacteria group bacterium]